MPHFIQRSFRISVACFGLLAAAWALPVQAQTIGDPDCDRILLASSWSTGRVKVFDACSGEHLRDLGSGSLLSGPQGIALDSDGSIVVVSENNNRLVRFDRQTLDATEVIFGDDPDTPGVEPAPLAAPTGLAISDDGRFFVASFSQHQVIEVDPSTGEATAVVIPPNSGLVSPDSGMELDGTTLLVPGFDSNNVLKADINQPGNAQQLVAAGAGGLSAARMAVPRPGNRLFVTSWRSGAVLSFNRSNGTFNKSVTQNVNRPSAIAFESDQVMLVTSDQTNDVKRIRISDGAMLGSLVAPGGGGLSGGTYLLLVDKIEEGGGPGEPGDCADAGFTINNGVAQVSASGGDDTAAIQCALDAAGEQGLPTVRLANGEYNISQLGVAKFSGSLEGTTRAQTIVHVMDESIDCAAMSDEGRVPSALKFIGGEPRVRLMTLTVGNPCQGASDDPFFLMHFTGDPASVDCSNDVIFANVDRVDLLSAATPEMGLGAIAMAPEGAIVESCKKTLLGTGKLNRSTIEGFHTGIYLGLRASGQVDVNFNSFSDNVHNVAIVNASQLLTIQENDFNRSANFGHDFFGVHLSTTDGNAPNKNRLVVHRNVFTLAGQNGANVRGVLLDQDGTIADLSVVATSNRFALNGDTIVGFDAVDVSGGIFANNSFTGQAESGLHLEGQDAMSVGWSVVGNNFGGGFSTAVADIHFGSGTDSGLVGPGQNASLLDLGTNNTVLGGGAGDTR